MSVGATSLVFSLLSYFGKFLTEYVKIIFWFFQKGKEVAPGAHQKFQDIHAKYIGNEANIYTRLGYLSLILVVVAWTGIWKMLFSGIAVVAALKALMPAPAKKKKKH